MSEAGEVPKPRPEPSFIRSFSRSQIASGVATAVDFGLVFLPDRDLHVWYVISVAVGAASGAITNFLLNRYWSFEATHRAGTDRQSVMPWFPGKPGAQYGRGSGR